MEKHSFYRPPMSLSSQTGLVILEKLRISAVHLESAYVAWLQSLDRRSAKFEEALDIRSLDPTEVVLKFLETDDAATKRPRRSRNSESSSHVKSGGVSGKKARKRISGELRRESRLSKFDYRVRKTPDGLGTLDYVKYRKCLFVETLHRWRSQLIGALSPPVLDELQQLATRLFRNCKDKSGVFSLQTMLLSEHSSGFLLLPNTLQKISNPYQGYSHMDHRIGSSTLHYSLQAVHSLTRLSLEEICTDLMCETISRLSNLKYLNISYSLCTDRGLLNLCGVHEDREAARPRLHRSCKRHKEDTPLVSNMVPRWVRQEGRGALNLTHLEAKSLNHLQWQQSSSVYQYVDYQQVPLDAGFVALLTFLPKLQVFKTEVGGRAVQSYVRGRSNRRRLKTDPLSLEVLSESHPTPAIMDCLAQYCPKLRELRCDWYHRYYTPHNLSREDWILHLKKLNLASLCTSNIDYKTGQLEEILMLKGTNFTILHLQELWSFKYSLMKAIKSYCPNLEKLSLIMTCKNTGGPSSIILVDKDVDLAHGSSLAESRRLPLRHLAQLHLVGPLGCDCARYLLAGCDNLRSLSLGIEWPDVAFCNVVPGSRRDLLGREYLDEVRAINSLAGLEEIHLFAQHNRGRTHLTKEFALHVLGELPRLRHFGNFSFWSMTHAQRQEVMGAARRTNRNITFDEDYTEEWALAGRLGSFRKNLKDCFKEKACSWLPFKSSSRYIHFDALADQGIAFAWYANSDDEDFDDDEGDNEYSDDGDDSSDDENMFVNNLAVGFDPLCVIQ